METLDSFLDAMGNTPLVARVKPAILAKHEMLNLLAQRTRSGFG